MQTSFFFRKTIILSLFATSQVSHAQSFPKVHDVALQPLKAQIQRLVQAKDYLGEPFSLQVKKRLNQALGQADGTVAISKVQQILDAQCLLDLSLIHI